MYPLLVRVLMNYKTYVIYSYCVVNHKTPTGLSFSLAPGLNLSVFDIAKFVIVFSTYILLVET